MTGSSTRTPRARKPLWFLRLHLFDRATIVLTALAAVTEATLIILGESQGGFAGLVITVVGVAVARRSRWAGLVLVVAGPLIDTALGYEPIVPWSIAIFTAFSVTIRGLPAVWVGALVGGTVYLAVVSSGTLGWVNPAAFAALGMSFAAAAAGSALNNQRRYWNELEQRARDAIANRESEANRRVTEERLRIARDLHDVVGHQIAVLNMHLGVAEVSLPTGAMKAHASLDEARTSVREILHETQRILHVLRTSSHSSEDALRPAPDFDGIPSLVDSVTAGGLDVHAQICPAPPTLAPEVGTAMFRIVQEGLTNAQKHGSGSATLRMSIDGDLLTVTMSNAVAAQVRVEDEHHGFGLIGMRERASSAGGVLDVDDEGDAFTVRATLRVDGGTVR